MRDVPSNTGSLLVATCDAIVTRDPVLDGTSLIRGDVLVIHYENTILTICDVLPTNRTVL